MEFLLLRFRRKLMMKLGRKWLNYYFSFQFLTVYHTVTAVTDIVCEVV